MRTLLAAALIAVPVAAAADGAVTYPYEGSFDDATFAVESEIVNRGLVIDFVSHVGEMLARTKEDVAGEKDIFTNADIFLFCSATVSRKVMEADAMNIAHCPYGIFVTESDSGTVAVGYRQMPAGEMQEVQSMLDEIARAAVGERTD